VRDELSRLEVWGGKLKTVLLRANSAGDVAGALFVKEELDFKEFQLPAELKGLDIYYSNPKSPASVPTKKLVSLGTTKMSDTIAGNQMEYDVLSFFQVNIPIFESALEVIKANVSGVDTIDMYSGVGAIGISVGARTLVESEASNIAMAKNNSKDLDIDVIHAESESALEHITPVSELIVDPPRAGLHKAVIDRINEVKPSKIIYLSCNPSTQSRDVKLLENHYNISYAQGFNFFPRTPHIESLIVMDLK
jgi:23S rRNA (uracil1939-C5)-methyltransferase